MLNKATLFLFTLVAKITGVKSLQIPCSSANYDDGFICGSICMDWSYSCLCGGQSFHVDDELYCCNPPEGLCNKDDLNRKLQLIFSFENIRLSLFAYLRTWDML